MLKLPLPLPLFVLALAAIPGLFPAVARADDGPDVDDDGDTWSENEGDCNDAAFGINPSAPEVDDDIDNNCNGYVDEVSGVTLPRAAIVMVGFEVKTKYYKVHYTQTPAANTFVPGELEAYSPSLFPVLHTFAGWVGTPATCSATGLKDPNPASGILVPQCGADKLVDFNYATAGTAVLDNNQRSVGGGFSTASTIAGTVTYDSDCSTTIPASSLELWISNDNLAWTKVASAEPYVLNCGDPIPNPESSIDDDGDGYTEQDGDCDDADETRYAGAVEIEDDLDNDCDGLVDNHLESYDDDGDGYTENGDGTHPGDCDDADENTYPGALEVKDGVDNNCDGRVDERTTTVNVGPGGSIQDAIDKAGPYDQIVVASGTYTAPLDFGGKDLYIVSSGGPENTVITTSSSDQPCVAFTSGETDFATLEGFTIRGCGAGGIRIVDSSPTLKKIYVEGCGGPGIDGGGISITGSKARPKSIGCRVKGNQGREGGGIFIDQAAGATLEDTEISDNLAAARGGGMCLARGTFAALRGCPLHRNKASGDGGAVFLEEENDLTLDEVYFIENVGVRGGAVCIGPRGKIAGITGGFTSNVGSGDGGAIFTDVSVQIDLDQFDAIGNSGARGGALWLGDDGIFRWRGGIFQQNQALGMGGAIFAGRHQLELEGCTFLENVAGEDAHGGALCLHDESTGTFRSVRFERNRARRGGAVYVINRSRLVLDTCELVDNHADELGGALAFRSHTDFSATASLFDGNDATIAGGAVFAEDYFLSAPHDILGCTFRNGVAGADGGALVYGRVPLLIDDSSFIDNESGANGGHLCIHYLAHTAMAGCRFYGGRAAGNGGGIFRVDADLDIRQSIFHSNLATGNGGAMCTVGDGGLELQNNTLVGNQAGHGGGIHGAPDLEAIRLVNTIVAFNPAGGGVVLDAAPPSTELRYNDVFGNPGDDWGGVLSGAPPTGTDGNISSDPRFTDYSGDFETDDLTLQSGSPARDAGDPAIEDQDGSRSDMGAFGGPAVDPVLEDADADTDGYSVLEGDCDDGDPAVNPDATEQGGNDVDEDCDGVAIDLDGDGDPAIEDGGTDCNDLSAEVNPDNPEVTGNLVDEDCDGFESDVDADGELAFDEGGPDCDDSDPAVNSGATEVGNGVDDDCDGSIDEGTEAFDDDGDGYTEVQNDCADDDPGRYPGATEVAGDGVDQDCDGQDQTGGGDDDTGSGDDDTGGGDDDTGSGDDDTGSGDDDTGSGDDDTGTGDDDTGTGDDDTGADDDDTGGGDDDTGSGDDDTGSGDDDSSATTAPGDGTLPPADVEGGGCTCDARPTPASSPGTSVAPALLALLLLSRLRHRDRTDSP